MKRILFIIVFSLKLLKSFAFHYDWDCDDIDLKNLEWLPNNHVSTYLHGPQPDCESLNYSEVCYQEGIEIVNHYKFTYNGNEIYTVWDERRWVNGYSEDNISGGKYGQVDDCMDCYKLYHGSIDYVQTDYYDPSKFPPPGTNIDVELMTYAGCRYSDSTYCRQGCKLTQTYAYNPK